MEFENIIFDLGGVILEIDYDKTADAFRKSGLKDFDELYSQARQTSLFDDLETGKISAAAFRDGLRKYINLENESIDACWNAMLKNIPEGRIEFLQKLSKSYRLFLLSNTNEIHITWYRQYLKKLTGKDTLVPTFEKEYYSHEIGMQKPHKEIFEFVCVQNNLDPRKTLFIDDTERHIKGAKSADLQTCFLKPGERIEELPIFSF